MRLLIIGHSYVAPFNQEKYATMKRLNPTLQLKIVSPRLVKDSYRAYKHAICPGLTMDEAVSLSSYFNFSNMMFIFNPFSLFKLMSEFKPDLIHIEEDPHSFVAFETICVASWTCPRTPISFFIWDNINRIGSFPFNLIKRFLTRFALARAAAVVAGNREAQQLLSLQKNYFGPSFVLPQFGIACANYQKEPRVEIARQVNKRQGIPIIGYMGRLIPEKGILELCRALEGLMNVPWKLAIVSSGPLEKTLREEWQPKFGDRLLLLGPGARAELPDYLKCFDLLVVPSVSTPTWKEQFGYILVEAMAAGVPVIGSSSGAIPEVVGDAGLIFPESDIPALRSGLERLLQSPTERTSLSKAGQARALHSFSHEVISESYLKVFEQITSNS